MTLYRWVAISDDGCFKDGMEGYHTQKEAYDDMRNAVLDKMKWNTEYDEDFDGDDSYIHYSVDFSKNKIIHTSYSGTYTYEIESYEDKDIYLKRGDKVYYGGTECIVCIDAEEDDTMVKITNATQFNLPHFEEMFADYVPISEIKFGN